MDNNSNTDSDDEVEYLTTRKLTLHHAALTTTGRVMSEVPQPPSDVLTSEECFNEDELPNVEVIKEWLKREGKLSKNDIFAIIQRVADVLKDEPNLLRIKSPITVCGDIHGQYYDLLKLLSIGGDPSEVPYLFLGDYVDRGCFSIECVLLLYCYKILYPTTFFLLRGNHECRHLTEYFTFKEEVLHKYDLEIYDAIMDSFDCLPLSAVLNNQFLCVHGGISPDIVQLSDIDKIDRFVEPPPFGPMCDLLWADPCEDFDIDTDFIHNQQRGCSYCYTYRGVTEFLNNNNLLSIIRAHEAQDSGFRMHRKTSKGFPSVITLFSAPNYLDAYGNKGAILKYDNDTLNIKQFSDTPHPYYLPSFINAFEWSMPFAVDKTFEIISKLLTFVNDEDEDEKKRRTDLLRNERIKSVGKLLRLYSQKNPTKNPLIKFGDLDLSTQQKTEVDFVFRHGSDPYPLKQSVVFSDVKITDAENEKRPPIPTDGFPMKSTSLPALTIMRKVQSEIYKDNFYHANKKS